MSTTVNDYSASGIKVLGDWDTVRQAVVFSVPDPSDGLELWVNDALINGVGLEEQVAAVNLADPDDVGEEIYSLVFFDKTEQKEVTYYNPACDTFCTACGTYLVSHSHTLGNCGNVAASNSEFTPGAGCSHSKTGGGNGIRLYCKDGFWRFTHYRDYNAGSVSYRAIEPGGCPDTVEWSLLYWHCNSGGSLTVNTVLSITEKP